MVTPSAPSPILFGCTRGSGSSCRGTACAGLVLLFCTKVCVAYVFVPLPAAGLWQLPWWPQWQRERMFTTQKSTVADWVPSKNENRRESFTESFSETFTFRVGYPLNGKLILEVPVKLSFFLISL
jgi:hypothetical protein